MTNEQSEIPLVTGNEFWLGLAVAPMDAEAVSRTALESERVGLLAAPAKHHDKDRRMEDWIASNLDLDDPAAPRHPFHTSDAAYPGDPSPFVRRRASSPLELVEDQLRRQRQRPFEPARQNREVLLLLHPINRRRQCLPRELRPEHVQQVFPLHFQASFVAQFAKDR